MIKKVSLFLIVLMIHAPLLASKYNEKYYQKKWCDAQKGEMEVVMGDKTRCDCVTKTHAVEIEFASKWAESVGQSLNYASYTGKIAGIAIIYRNEKELQKVGSVQRLIIIYDLPINLWKIKGEQ